MFSCQSAWSRYFDRKSAASLSSRLDQTADASTLKRKHSVQIIFVKDESSAIGPPPFRRLATAAVLSNTNVTFAFSMCLQMLGVRRAQSKPSNSRHVELVSGAQSFFSNRPNADSPSTCAPHPSSDASVCRKKAESPRISAFPLKCLRDSFQNDSSPTANSESVRVCPHDLASFNEAYNARV